MDNNAAVPPLSERAAGPSPVSGVGSLVLTEWLARFLERKRPFVYKLLTHGGQYVGLLALVLGILLPQFIAGLGVVVKLELTFYGFNLLLVAFLFMLVPATRPIKSHDVELLELVSVVKDRLYPLLVFWILLYVFLLTSDILVLGGREGAARHMIQLAQLANVASGGVLLSIYRLLATGTTKKRGLIFHVSWYVTLGAVVLVVSAAVAPFFQGRPDLVEPTRLDYLATVFNGLLVGTATALVVARLDSHYLGIKHSVIGMLSFYAVIQPLFGYVVFREELVAVRAVLIVVALVGKALLVLCILAVVDKGYLSFYFSETANLNLAVSARRRLYFRRLNAANGVVEPVHNLVFYADPEPFELAGTYLRGGLVCRYYGDIGWEVTGIRFREIRFGSKIHFSLDDGNILAEGPPVVSDKGREAPFAVNLQVETSELWLADVVGRECHLNQKSCPALLVDGAVQLARQGAQPEPYWSELRSNRHTNELEISVRCAEVSE